MIYYDADTNKVDNTKVIQNITFNVTNAMATTGIQGYSVVCTGFDVPNMRISFKITHIGYPVEILFYTGSVFKREKEFSTTYKTTLDLIKDPSLTPQQKQDAVDAQIAKTNTSIAMMLYDQIKTHQVLKSFEKLVYDKYVVPKNFPSPEKMVEEFKAYHEAVKSIPSPIPFPCTIDDWWMKFEEVIKRNTALSSCTLSRDYSLMKKYITGNMKDCTIPAVFSVTIDLYEVYSFSSPEEMESDLDALDFFENNFINELNGIPAIVQTSIPTVQPQQAAV